MSIEPPEPCPERDRLTEIVGHCEKRLHRARQKLAAAGAEQEAADAALAVAQLSLRHWLIANPDPQGSLL